MHRFALTNLFFGTAALLVGSSAFAQGEGAGDSVRWRYLTSSPEAVVIVAAEVEGQSDDKKVRTYTAFAKPHSSGAEGYVTEYEVDCQAETINSLGSTVYAGDAELGRVPSQTADGAVAYEAGTLFGDIAAYACFRRVASGDKNVVTGRTQAVEHARKRAQRR